MAVSDQHGAAEHAKVTAGGDRQGHHGSAFDLGEDAVVCRSGSSRWADIDGPFWSLPVYGEAWQPPGVCLEASGWTTVHKCR